MLIDSCHECTYGSPYFAEKRKTIIPSPGGLLKTIEGQFELADKVWMAGINVAEWLIHINVLLQSAMQKGVASI